MATLHHAFPDAEIDWVVERAHAGLLALVPVLSRVVVLGDRTAGGWVTVVRTLRARRYDLAIDLQGLVKSAALARLSGAMSVAGFDRTGLREPAARFFYSENVVVGDQCHVIDKNLALVRGVTSAGAKPTVDDRADSRTSPSYSFPLAEPPSAALGILHSQGVTEFAVLNPGAAWPNKRWPPESFAAVALFIHATYGWTPIVLWGPGEQAIAQAICDASGGVARSAPSTTLADLVAIARAARLFVSGDTGPLHIAGATATPIVALFGPTSPARNGPWDDRDVSISRYDSCACHYKRVCQRQGSWCLAQITVDEVTRAIRERLGR
ncbi:MAG: glycosyltransferase family 9 protein [Vicinamibacterales bacterium]